ncbi:MAG: hypothetical protein FJ027_01040 [Candidatus Rokubacteria bacterium]|nr:hypothetical protein [Candidatus Rokubacteria bacterium]
MSGVALIDDLDVAQTMRRQASRVWREATAIGIVVTGVVMLARALFGN